MKFKVRVAIQLVSQQTAGFAKVKKLGFRFCLILT